MARFVFAFARDKTSQFASDFVESYDMLLPTEGAEVLQINGVARKRLSTSARRQPVVNLPPASPHRRLQKVMHQHTPATM